MAPSLSCAGNALYNVVAFVETDFASRIGYHAGSTMHAGSAEIRSLMDSLPGAARGAGGGATGTARVFASLGHTASFAGLVGSDELGAAFKADLAEIGVRAFLQERDGPTGAYCAMIAPDGERTIAVAPGVAPSIDPALIPDAFFAPDSALYLDGFLAANPEAVLALVARAEAARMRIALDVAGFRTATKHRELFLRLIRRSCSWTFMNEDEFIALSECGVDAALQRFSAEAPGVIIVKRAETGAVCVSDGSVLESAVRPIRATDKTGAGDAFAAGFLAAALAEEPLARCLRLGNRVAEQTIQVAGMSLDGERLRRAARAVL